MLRHLNSLRTMRRDHGWIHTLLGKKLLQIQLVSSMWRVLVFRADVVGFEPSSVEYMYYRFIVRFPIGLDFLFIILFPHFFLSWRSSLLISSSAMFTSTLPKHVFLGRPTGILPSTLYSIPFFVLLTFLNHMTIPSQSTTSNDSCVRLNYNQPSQFFTCPSVFQGNTTH